MAVLATDCLTLSDWFGRRDPNGQHAEIVNVMSRKDEMFQDVMFMEANGVTIHEDTLASELPQGEFRAFNEGVGRGRAKTQKIRDGIANNQLYGVVDKDLADLSGDAASFRFREEKLVMEGIRQQYMDTLLYGNAITNPKSFTGLTPRYNSTTDERVITASDSANLTSIWFVVWGDMSVRGIFPKGMSDSAGLSATDKGVETVLDANNKEYEAYRTHYKWMSGLSIKDYRQVVRICNINSVTPTADLVNLMLEAVELIEDPSNLKIYMNRRMRTHFNKQARTNTNAYLTIESYEGKRYTSFHGYPLRRTDAIINAESLVTA